MQNEIQGPGLNEILAKRLSMQGGPPASVLGAEVMPAMVLESDRTEWAFLAGTRLGWAGGAVTSGVADYSSMVLYNPPNSGALAVVEALELGWDIAVPTGGSIYVIVSASLAIGHTPGGTYGSSVRDSRMVSAGKQLSCQFTMGVGAMALPPHYLRYWVSAVSNPNLKGVPGEIVLDPGSVLMVQKRTFQSTLNAFVSWRERRIGMLESR